MLGRKSFEIALKLLFRSDRNGAYGEIDPLARSSGMLDNDNLKIFFDYAARERMRFNGAKLEDVIKRSGA